MVLNIIYRKMGLFKNQIKYLNKLQIQRVLSYNIVELEKFKTFLV